MYMALIAGAGYEEPQSNECLPANQTFSGYEIDLVSIL
jgi:hypothetical protein